LSSEYGDEESPESFMASDAHRSEISDDIGAKSFKTYKTLKTNKKGKGKKKKKHKNNHTTINS
jgi:hypothetical protein